MGTVLIQEHTTKFPLQLIGEEAGICWGGDTTVDAKNIKRAWNCINSGHGRTTEYPDVYMVLDGYSARVIREFYTHIGGAPTRLQASTRYIDYAGKGFEYITPPAIKNHPGDAQQYWDEMMKNLNEDLRVLQDKYGIPKEDIANGLPLGMTTKVVVKINMRTLVEMSHQRMCSRAYWEFRQLFNDIYKALSAYSEEWSEIAKVLFVPKCEFFGYCNEERGSCGRRPSKEEFFNACEKGIQLLKYADNPTLEYGA